MKMQLPEATRLFMPCIFADDMLFQQKMPIGVWGIDLPGTTVHISLQGSVHSRHGTAVAGLHASAETVHLGTMTLVRLISTKHSCHSFDPGTG